MSVASFRVNDGLIAYSCLWTDCGRMGAIFLFPVLYVLCPHNFILDLIS